MEQEQQQSSQSLQPLPDPLPLPSIPPLPSLPPPHSSLNPVGPLSSTSGPLLAVEQPMVNGESNCFVCGVFLDENQRKTAFGSQDLLPGCSSTPLDVLGAALGLGLATDQPVIELCLNCAKLTSSIDETFASLYQLRMELSRLFHCNNRPKLTLQLIPKASATTTSPTATSTTTASTTSTSFNLDDLAATRSRRGRRKGTTTASTPNTTEVTASTTTTTTTTTTATPTSTAAAAKRKGGRPRKPFPCTMCRRKFLTARSVVAHLNRDHDKRIGLPGNPVGLGSSEQTQPQQNIKRESHEATGTAQSNVESNGMVLKAEMPNRSINSVQIQPKQPTNQVLGAQASANQVLASLRPIQPKPQAVRGQTRDGSLVVLLNSNDSTTAVIKMTPNYPGLKTHTNTHTSAHMYTCDVCAKVFNDEKSRKMHRIAAHGKRKQGIHSGVHACAFVCTTCPDMSFTTRRELNAHRRTSHPRVHRYSCMRCPAVFAYKYELNRHAETHIAYIQTDAHEFVCRLCGLHVASRAALKIHIHRFHAHEAENAHENAHDTQKPQFLCATCGYLARTRKAFTDHQRVHDPKEEKDAHEKTVTCTLCNKNMLGSSLRVHVRRMHGEAAYSCAHCGERFCVRSDLMRHVNVQHSGIKAYMCDHQMCTQSFSTSDALRYHRNKVHSTETHTCTHCSKTYRWKGELRTHIQRVHAHIRERFSCSVCTRSYADKRKLRAHMSIKHGKSMDKEQEQPPPQPPPQPLPPPQSIVTIPILQSTNQLSPHDLHQPITEQEALEQPITGKIYLVPNLSVPIHEEQVSTT